MPRIPGGCGICDTLPADRLVELDLLMGDSSRWPSTVWRNFNTPQGPIIPPAMRRWGAVRLGRAWLDEHGFGDLASSASRHYNAGHVPVIAVDPDTLVANGVMVAGGSELPDHRINPIAFLDFYHRGIEAGTKGIDLLMAHVKKLEDAKEEVPLTLIKMLVDVGGKLAVSQATLKAREPSQPQGDDDEGFRAGAGGLPSPRYGHTRIRTVDGVTGPVHDEGPADRTTYNERAKQEGSPEL